MQSVTNCINYYKATSYFFLNFTFSADQRQNWILLLVPVCIAFVVNSFEAFTDAMQNVQYAALRHRAPLIPQLLQNSPQTSLLHRNNSVKWHTAHLRSHWTLGLVRGLEQKSRTGPTYTDVWEQQPGLTLPAALHEGVWGQAEDVGVVEEAVHLHLGLSLLAALAVMAKDPL